jgi:hypothetical protein
VPIAGRAVTTVRATADEEREVEHQHGVAEGRERTGIERTQHQFLVQQGQTRPSTTTAAPP